MYGLKGTLCDSLGHTTESSPRFCVFAFDFEFWVFLLNSVLFGEEVARAEHRCEGMGRGKSGIGMHDVKPTENQ